MCDIFKDMKFVLFMISENLIFFKTTYPNNKGKAFILFLFSQFKNVTSENILKIGTRLYPRCPGGKKKMKTFKLKIFVKKRLDRFCLIL